MNKKTLSRIATSVSIILFLTAVITWGYTRLSIREKQTETDLYTLVPRECDAILETKNIHTLYKNIQHSCFNQEYNDLHISKLLNFLTDNLEKLANQQAHGLSPDMSQLLVSFHQPESTYDQVIYGKMNEDDKTFIERIMQSDSSPTFPPKTVEYKGERITIYPLGKEFMACYFQPGFFAISLQKKLIEKVIDAHKEHRSICTDAQFDKLRKRNKRNEPLTLYLHDTQHPQIQWLEFDIRMNAEAVFLTGGQMANDTCLLFGSPIHRQMPLINDTELPGHIKMMYQLPFAQDIGEDTTANNTFRPLEKWLAEHDCQEVDAIMFTSQEQPDSSLQLLSIPLKKSNAEEMQDELKRSRKALAGHWLQGTFYPIWSYEGGEKMPHYFITRPHVRDYCLTFYKEKMLVATTPEILLDYLKEMTSQPDGQEPHNRQLYQYCLNDLAEQANFTLVADMNDLMGTTMDNHPPTRLLPAFFFKHKDFFKNFMFSTQFIYTNGQINTNLILRYQGDSLLRKKIQATLP